MQMYQLEKHAHVTRLLKKRWAFHAEEDEANVFLLENVVSAFEV